MKGKLTASDWEMFTRFKIPAELIEAAGIERVSDQGARDLIGTTRHGDMNGLLFPYFQPNGNGRASTFRLRRDNPEMEKGKPKNKYISPSHNNRHLYFPPGARELLTNPKTIILFVEAEKSSLAVLAWSKRLVLGIPVLPIAVGGVWGWRGRIGKTVNSKGKRVDETGPLPDLACVKNRQVGILFDSNAADNRDVKRAQAAFDSTFRELGASAVIKLSLPKGDWNGPDDYIAAVGDDAMLKVLESKPGPEGVAAAEQAIAALESDKKADPIPAIEAVGAVRDAARRELLIGRLAALKISGVTRKFIEQQISECHDKAEAERKEAATTSERSRLLALGETMCGAELLDRCCAFIRRFVLLSEEQAQVITLWAVHTHALHAAEHTPYLAINSPEKRSGKTRLLEVLKELVVKPWLTGRVSAAVLPRKIELEQPTLLLDESDAAFSGEKEYAEALRRILNTGHQRGGVTTICVKVDGDFVAHDFSTFCPKAIAGIGKLPDTVADRSIPIRLKRKKKGEKIARFRLRDQGLKAEAAELHEQLAAYSIANVEKLRDARPELPEPLNDRQQDGAEPLLAVADAVAGEWPEKARRALVMLCAEEQAASESIGVWLLSDIRDIFKSRDVDRFPSAELADALAQIEESPWGEWSKGKAISPAKVANLLRAYGITPHNIRVRDGKVLKGYEQEDFADVWVRYLSADTPSTLNSSLSKRYTATTHVNTGENETSRSATPTQCSGSENAQIAFENVPCSGVADSNLLPRGKGVEEGEL